jgi:hypothetical protein
VILKQTSHPKARTANPEEFVHIGLVRNLEGVVLFVESVNDSICAFVRKGRR